MADITIPPEQVGVTPDGSCVDGISEWKNAFGYSAFDGATYDGRCSFFEGSPPLPEGLGWFIVIGLGAFFALLTSVMVWISNRQSSNGNLAENAEHYSTAGRNVVAGLTASDCVSKWTWAATLLQSSNVAYKFGVSGPFWYASGATIQILLFAILAVEIKRKCPAIHTVLEVVYIRWGERAHKVFLFFCLLTNLIVTSMLILGGAAVINALTGVNTFAVCFIVPLGVFTYTAFGGLKANYYAAWSAASVIFLAMLVFLWMVYGGGSADLGSSGAVYDQLVISAIKNPVEGNSNGSHLTMYSQSGLIFGIVNIVGNFGTVFVDQSYWQGAIASKPSATYKGYLLGGMAWFSIPFSLATTLGLAARALDLPITIGESNSGLVPPAVAVHLMGMSGAFLVTLQLFLALTSTSNSEQLAVATLVAYDVYKRYKRPDATGKEIVYVMRCTVFGWAIVSGIGALILLELGISLGFVYMAMGNMVGSAVAPIAFAIMWKDCSAHGAVAGALGGLGSSIIGWMTVAFVMDGEVNLATLGKDYPMLAGNLLALCASAIICVVVSCIQPQDFDWEVLRSESEKLLLEADPNARLPDDDSDDSQAGMDRVRGWTFRTALGLTVLLIIIWPLLTLPEDPFSKSYFGWWVAVAFIWAHVAAFIAVIFPIWEVRHDLAVIMGVKYGFGNPFGSSSPDTSSGKGSLAGDSFASPTLDRSPSSKAFV